MDTNDPDFGPDDIVGNNDNDSVSIDVTLDDYLQYQVDADDSNAKNWGDDSALFADRSDIFDTEAGAIAAANYQSIYSRNLRHN